MNAAAHTANLINITDMTDAVFDIYMKAKGDEDACISVEHLTKTELGQLADAMGWEPSLRLALWKQSTDARAEKETGPCYHNAIMDRQERDSGEW